MPRIKSTLLLWVIAATSGLFAQQYDVLIRNGRLVDGRGNPSTYADRGVIGDRVAFVGRAGQGVTAKRTLDATGLTVAPGFIDMLGTVGIQPLDRQARRQQARAGCDHGNHMRRRLDSAHERKTRGRERRRARALQDHSGLAFAGGSTFSGWLSREAPSTSGPTWVQRKAGGW